MKRLFITALVFAIAGLVFAFSPPADKLPQTLAMGPAALLVSSGSPPADGDGKNCPSGTWDAAYDGDSTDGADYICWDSSTTEQGTENGTPSVSADYVEINSTDEGLQWVVTGDLPADFDSEGTVFFEFYSTDESHIRDIAIWELTYDATEKIYCYAQDSFDSLRCYHNGNGGTNYVNINSMSTQTWYRCGYSWCDGASGCNGNTDAHHIKCVTNGSVDFSTPENEDNETVNGFDSAGAVDADEFTIGEDESGVSVGSTSRIRNVFFVDGYEATDPGSI